MPLAHRKEGRERYFEGSSNLGVGLELAVGPVVVPYLETHALLNL